MVLPNLALRYSNLKPVDNYRVPYHFSDDYWLYRQWSAYAVQHYKVIVLGDSSVWGQYVRPGETLSASLNRLSGKPTYANMGLEGSHPLALDGLVQYDLGAIRDTRVLVQYNPLWMTSPEKDLSGTKPTRFNHPALIPQIYPRIACYQASLADRAGVLIERDVPFFCWLAHQRITALENQGMKEWALENPYRNPFEAISGKNLQPEDQPQSNPISWLDSGIEEQDFPWVNAAHSRQWAAFQHSVRLLKARGNKVFVIVGPFNTYLLSPDSLKRYRALQAELSSWLQQNHIDFYVPAELPSELYGDASHPLEGGYAMIAQEILKNPRFRGWMGEK